MENENLTSKLSPRSWRSEEMHERYQSERQTALEDPTACPLCTAQTLQSFTYWRLIDNKYPYDAVAITHHMLLPIRHSDGSDLTSAERDELELLKKTQLNKQFSFILEALPGTKSIPGHYHLHLIQPKII